ncbi:MAG: Fic family protein [Patescibacteria group bacterium]
MAKKQSAIRDSQEVLNLLKSYNKALTILRKYDDGELKAPKGKKTKFVLKYEDCRNVVLELRKSLFISAKGGSASGGKNNLAQSLFGQERGGMFEGIIKNIYQTFDKKHLYTSIEERAAHLFYFLVKDHPFSDGNKRIGAFMFVYFLDKSEYLSGKNGEKKIDNNSLVALTLLIAESNPIEKETMIKIIMNLINN